MQFDYEIPVAEFAAAQVLYYKTSGNTLMRRAFGFIVLGLSFALIALFRWADLGPALLLLTGLWLIYCGVLNLFPYSHFGRAYSHSTLAGKRYRAEVDESGFSVTGNSCSWRVLWTDGPLKAENNRVFMFSAKGTLFIFGKKYLTEEQQRELRQLAAMT